MKKMLIIGIQKGLVKLYFANYTFICRGELLFRLERRKTLNMRGKMNMKRLLERDLKTDVPIKETDIIHIPVKEFHINFSSI